MQPVSGNIAHTSPVMVKDGMVPVGDVTRTSQPNLSRRFPIANMELSSDELEEGQDLVSFNDIMDAIDRTVEQFEEEPMASHVSCPQSRKRKAPVFSDESSETEYSSSNESFVSVIDNLDTFCRCTTSSSKVLHSCMRWSSFTSAQMKMRMLILILVDPFFIELC